MYRQFLRTLASKSSQRVCGKPSMKRRIPANIMDDQLKMMKIDSAQFKELFTPELNQLIDNFKKFNYELRIAGGAVRDLLTGVIPHDIDFATTATPEQMKDMFNSLEIRMINNKGEKHGTITARINDKENFEVTTLRIDVATDGRHAEVEFTKDWQLDANRRDLTINAMFLDLEGTLYDYFNGKKDLDDRKTVFVGNAEERIQEDYLRILRYFRFYGRIARHADGHDAETLNAIQRNAHGLANISGERLWTEVKKIVTGRFAEDIMNRMVKLGVGQYIGLPSAPQMDEFKAVCSRTEELSPLHMTRISAMLKDESEIYEMHKRMKLSNEELKLGLFLIQHRNDDLGDDIFRYCRDLLIDTSGKEPRVKDKIHELLKYKGEVTALNEFTNWSPPRFPVTGHDLFAANVPKGPVFAKTLQELRQVWKKSDCELTKEELINKIDDVVKNLST